MSIEFDVGLRPATGLQVASQLQWGQQLRIIGKTLFLAWLAAAYPLGSLLQGLIAGEGPFDLFNATHVASIVLPLVCVFWVASVLSWVARKGQHLETQAESLSPLLSECVATMSREHPEVDTHRIKVVALRHLTNGDYHAMRTFIANQAAGAMKANAQARREAEETALKDAFEQIHKPCPLNALATPSTNPGA